MPPFLLPQAPLGPITAERPHPSLHILKKVNRVPAPAATR